MTPPSVKRLLFLTGTRADYGKLKPLMQAADQSDKFHCCVFVTGMHTLEKYGFTVDEVRRGGFRNMFVYGNQVIGESMDLILANTVHGLARYVQDSLPDLMIVHGDRVEALAGAIVGAMRNIPTAHIEGGELSGTVDDLIRHSVSKLSHIHFVSNEEAGRRLIQMGEERDSIYVIGSPDIDVMLSDRLPRMDQVRTHYAIDYDRFAIALFHPVTTELTNLQRFAADFFDALAESGENYVVIYPNNDHGTQEILNVMERHRANRRFRTLPSLRFEYFLTLLKNAQFIAGNSSAGIREAPVYGVPTVNVGTRQRDRYSYRSIIDTSYEKQAIAAGIRTALSIGPQAPSTHFGQGNSKDLFMQALNGDKIWQLGQKSFQDRPSETAREESHHTP